MDGHFCELAAISMQHDLQHAIVLAAQTGVREIARLMTIGRDLLTKAETVTVAAIEAVPSLVEAPPEPPGLSCIRDDAARDRGQVASQGNGPLGRALSCFGGVQPYRRWPLIALPLPPSRAGGVAI